MNARHALTILAVPDLEASTRFYERAFGWPTSVRVPVYVEFVLPDAMRFGVYEREAFGNNTGRVPTRTPEGELAPTELYFYVDDLGSACARVVAAGGRELSPPKVRAWGDEAAYFSDPDGNVLVVAKKSDAPTS